MECKQTDRQTAPREGNGHASLTLNTNHRLSSSDNRSNMRDIQKRPRTDQKLFREIETEHHAMSEPKLLLVDRL